ncbi:MAG TPA: hypothetical protein VLA19_02720 [Herpetosiphonaceae bacterium]|nr:hypothetical protein [Herpetosiphonaceae bacterium]
MLTITLPQRLQLLAAYGYDVVTTPSPLCDRIWRRAQDEGLALGALYVLRSPIDLGVGGSYNRHTRDIYIVQDPDESELHAARMLLHELAHAASLCDVPVTVDEDWDEEVRTFRRARDLAEHWGFHAVLQDDWPEDEIAIIEERLRQQHHEAAAIAGSRDPGTARSAWATLLAIKLDRGWDHETFDLAISGIADDPDANASMVDFDRCTLRSCWSLFQPGIDFGAFALPQNERSAHWLRDALRRVAGRTVAPPFRALGPDTYVERLRCVQLDRGTGLEEAIAVLNTALLDMPGTSALACWHLYAGEAGRGGQRIYRLSVTYAGQQPTEVWVLVRARHEPDLYAEAALQRFIRSWRRATGLQVAPLGEGLEVLWSQLAVRS